MSNAKHTPGPWRVNPKYKMSVETVAGGQGMDIIAECCDPDGDRTAGEDMANAAMIAAAPDLLAACQAMITWDDREKDHAVDFYARMELCEAAFAAARAAIAKANGE